MKKKIKKLVAFALSLVLLCGIPSILAGAYTVAEYKSDGLSHSSNLLWQVEDYFANKYVENAGKLSTSPIYEDFNADIYSGTQWRFEYLNTDGKFVDFEKVGIRFGNNSAGTASFIDRRYFKMNGVNTEIIYSDASTVSEESGIATKASPETYASKQGLLFRPNKVTNTKTVAVSYVVPFSGIYNVGYWYTSGNTKASAQLYNDNARKALNGAADQSVRYLVCAMSENDTYSATYNPTTPIYEGKLDSTSTSRYFPSQSGGIYKNEVELKAGQVVRFIIDCSKFTAEYSNVLFSTLPRVTLVRRTAESVPTFTEEKIAELYQEKGVNSYLSSMFWATENYYVEEVFSGYEYADATAGDYNIVSTDGLDTITANYSDGSTWRAEYYDKSTDTFKNLDYITGRLKVNADGEKKTERLAFGVDNSNASLFSTQPNIAYTDTGIAKNGTPEKYNNNTLVTPNANYSVLGCSYTAPEEGVYFVNYPWQALNMSSTWKTIYEKFPNDKIKVKLSVVKMSAGDTLSNAKTVFECSREMTAEDANTDNATIIPTVDAIFNVHLNKGEVLRFVIDMSESTRFTSYAQVKFYPSLSFNAIAIGDANGDGMVDARDIVHIKKVFAELISAPESQKGADFNANGELSLDDLVLLRTYFLNK